MDIKMNKSSIYETFDVFTKFYRNMKGEED